MHQSLGKQLKGSRNCSSPIGSFGNPGQQIAAEPQLLQLRLKYSNIKVILPRIVPINCDLIDACRGRNIPGTHAVIAEASKELSRSGQNAFASPTPLMARRSSYDSMAQLSC